MPSRCVGFNRQLVGSATLQGKNFLFCCFPSFPHAFSGNRAPVRARHISTVKVRVGVCHSSVAEGNCVVVRQCGEQPEANCWSVGERTRFGGKLRRACDSKAKSEKSLGTLAWWEKRCPGSPRGWRRNDRKMWRGKRGDLHR